MDNENERDDRDRIPSGSDLSRRVTWGSEGWRGELTIKPSVPPMRQVQSNPQPIETLSTAELGITPTDSAKPTRTRWLIVIVICIAASIPISVGIFAGLQHGAWYGIEMALGVILSLVALFVGAEAVRFLFRKLFDVEIGDEAVAVFAIVIYFVIRLFV